MPDLSQNDRSGFTKPIGPVARLLGFRWVERTEDHAILRCPRWLPASVVKTTAERIASDGDYRLLYGKQARVTVGKRLIRFDWEATDA